MLRQHHATLIIIIHKGSVQRLIFWGILIIILLIVGLIIDQLYYRIIRLFLEKHTAQIVRLYTFIAVMVLMVGGYLMGHYVTRLQVEITTAEIKSEKLPASFDGFRIAQISDFHIGSFLDERGKEFVPKLFDEIIAQQPDIIVFTGDLVSMRAAEALPFRSELKRLASAGIPVYSIMGNHDYADYMRHFDDQRRKQDVDSLMNLQREAGWQMLNNSTSLLYRGNDSIALVGVENIGEPPFSVYGNLNDAMQPIGGLNGADNLFSILLSHNPTHWESEVIPQTDIDLTLSGHTHDMQFRLFGWSPSGLKYDEHSGLYQHGSQYLYVNTGVGCVGPKLRVGVKPEITMITLKR